jgi:hypothetical protein
VAAVAAAAAAAAEALILAVPPKAEEKGIAAADGPVTGNEVRDAPFSKGSDRQRTSSVAVAEPTLPANLAAAAKAKAATQARSSVWKGGWDMPKF